MESYQRAHKSTQGRQEKQAKKGILYEKQEKKCYICQYVMISKHLQVHHITPKCLGGNNHTKNLVLLCKKCHHMLHKIMNLELFEVSKASEDKAKKKFFEYLFKKRIDYLKFEELLVPVLNRLKKWKKPI